MFARSTGIGSPLCFISAYILSSSCLISWSLFFDSSNSIESSIFCIFSAMGAKGGEIEGIRSTETAAVICHGFFSSEGFVLVEFRDFGTNCNVARCILLVLQIEENILMTVQWFSFTDHVILISLILS